VYTGFPPPLPPPLLRVPCLSKITDI
jgi:hypothetical protein